MTVTENEAQVAPVPADAPAEVDDWEDPSPVTEPSLDDRLQRAVTSLVTERVAAKTRPRAKKREIAQRESKALSLLQEQPVSIFHLSRETGISFPRAQKLVARLLTEGKVVELTEGKRTLYKATGTPRTPKSGDASTAPAKTPLPLPPVNSATILNKFHMGREFLVVGIHITADGEYVELKSRDEGETIRVAII